MRYFEITQIPTDPTHIAPDGSEIRELAELRSGGLAHCKLPVGVTSSAVVHKSVDEIWHFVQGKGQVWRKCSWDAQDQGRVQDVEAGVSIIIPAGIAFQFRNTGDEPLVFYILTAPPWPGPDEAMKVKDYWQPT